MNLVGAELSELSRGTCTIAVERRPELLQQHGFFHGGVTAFLVDNATTIAAATSRGQAALTAEYKLNLLSPAVGEKLICRARVIKPGRQVSVVAADVFCVSDGVEKHTATALASIAMLSEDVAAENEKPGRLRQPGFASLREREAYFSVSSAAGAGSSSCWASGSKNSPAAAIASAAASRSSLRVEMSSPRLMRSASSWLRATVTETSTSTSG